MVDFFRVFGRPSRQASAYLTPVEHAAESGREERKAHHRIGRGRGEEEGRGKEGGERVAGEYMRCMSMLIGMTMLWVGCRRDGRGMEWKGMDGHVWLGSCRIW